MIYGAGGMGRECAWIADSNLFGFVLRFFYDDNKTISSCNGVPILANINPIYSLLISVAEPQARQQIVMKLKGKYEYCNLISNSARIHENSKMGNGCIIGFDCIVSVDVNLGNHCLVNARTIIGHDSVLEDFVSLMYNVSISGNVRIGEGSLIGSGAVVLPNVNIGKWCKIGAGAVITKDIPDNSVVVGVPGKIIKEIKLYE